MLDGERPVVRYGSDAAGRMRMEKLGMAPGRRVDVSQPPNSIPTIRRLIATALAALSETMVGTEPAFVT